MKYLYTVAFAFIVFAPAAFSQQDTTYLYFSKDWKETTKDTPYYKGIIYKQDTLWKTKYFYARTGVLHRDVTCLEKDCKTRQGIAKYYYESGALKSTSLYENGKQKTADWYYESGKKKAHANYIGSKAEETGWDESGNVIPGYIAEREAHFPGGTLAWSRYLEQNLDAGVAAKSRAKVGNYTVKVQFIVDKEGNISNVNAIEVPKGCRPCGKEAVRAIKNGPNWEPAIQDNKRVIYQAIQHITFQVAEE